jgi:hypothetical protein
MHTVVHQLTVVAEVLHATVDPDGISPDALDNDRDGLEAVVPHGSVACHEGVSLHDATLRSACQVVCATPPCVVCTLVGIPVGLTRRI